MDKKAKQEEKSREREHPIIKQEEDKEEKGVGGEARDRKGNIRRVCESASEWAGAVISALDYLTVLQSVQIIQAVSGCNALY